MIDRGTATRVFSGFRAAPAAVPGGHHGRGLGPGLAFRQEAAATRRARSRGDRETRADRGGSVRSSSRRSPTERRSSSAITRPMPLLLERARARSPAELAAVSRRDVFLPHLWQNPELYRGVPIHLLGTALRVLRYPSKLSKTGWIYEASIITPDATRNPLRVRVRRSPRGAADRPQRLRARGLQRLLPQDLEVPGGRRGRAAPRSWSAGSAGSRASQPAPMATTRPCAGR